MSITEAAAPPRRLALSQAEAAEALGVSENHFREHIAHELAWVYRGRRRFVSITELEHWLDRNGERVT